MKPTSRGQTITPSGRPGHGIVTANAFGVYSTSIDWGYDATKPGQAGGILKDLQKQIDQLKSMQAPVETSWRKARAELRVREAASDEYRKFYTSEFDILKNRANAMEPARAVVVTTPRARAGQRSQVCGSSGGSFPQATTAPKSG